jgi:CRP-like cAMP-binding protein
VADPKLERLAAVPLFARCDKKDLQFLASRIDEVKVPAGKALITEGQPTESFVILTSGRVRVNRNGKVVAELGPGDFFGEIGMIDRGPATATVVTEEPVDAMVLSHAQFRDAIRGNDKLAIQVLSAMAQRLRANALD